MPPTTNSPTDATAPPLVLSGPVQRGHAARVLGLFGNVQSNEVPGVLLFAANGFLLMTSYYILKTVREPLILLGNGPWFGGGELKTYAAGAQALLLTGIVPLYGKLARRVNRTRLIRLTVLVLVACLLLFALLGHLGVPIGVPYYLWLGMASLIAIAQFWSFANDYYSRVQGERLFPFIAAGATLGAVLGAGIARWLLGWVGLMQLMLVAAALLVVYSLICSLVERLHHPDSLAAADAVRPVGGQGTFRLIRGSRYLLLIGMTVLIATLVNTQGEYIFAEAVNARAEQLVPDPGPQQTSAADGSDVLKARRVAVGKIYGEFYGVVNVLAFAIQLLLVSRLFKHLGISRTLFVFPIVALASYGSMAALPAFGLIAAAKTLENSTDYSLHNTVRHALFLPTGRDAKYRGKTAIDAFFFRCGDLLAGATVFAGIHLLGLSSRQFALSNVALILAWLMVAVGLARHYRALASQDAAGQESGRV